MIELVKNKISSFIIDQKIKHTSNTNQSFNNIFSKSYNILILMPEDQSDFNHCFDVLNSVDNSIRNIYVLTYDFRVSLLPQKFRQKAFEHGINDKTRLNLPTNKFIEKLRYKNINAVLDLNRKENLFYSYVANLVNAYLKVGFVKKDADKYYNFQVVNKEENQEISYKNYLNCLQLF